VKRRRNYRREYDTYHAKPEQKTNRASRNRARRALAKKGLVRKGQEVDHVDGNPRNNSPVNLKAVSRRYNRKKQ